MKAILSTDISSILSKYFALDAELISTYHIEPGSLEGCVKRTRDDLATADSSFQFFEIKDGETEVGFFGKEHSNYLTTIFIHPKYRGKSSIGKVWDLICSHFDNDFYTAVYAKNLRARKFFSRNGKQIDEFYSDGNQAVSFKFSKEEKEVIVCQ